MEPVDLQAIEEITQKVATRYARDPLVRSSVKTSLSDVSRENMKMGPIIIQ